MHSIVRGRHLLDTIFLNLLTKEQVKTLPNSKWGKPIWDAFPASQQGEDVKVLTHSYLGRLVPLSRAILLTPASTYCTLANGLSYPKLPTGREPMIAVVLKNQRPAYLNINLSRHAWRELGSLLNLNRMGMAGGALALDHLKNIQAQAVDVWVGGLVADKGKLLDAAEWNFSLPLDLLDSAQIEKYKKGVKKANQGEFSLKKGIDEYCKYLKAEAGGFKARAVTAYWTTLDADHKKLIDIACDPYAPMEQWREFLVKTIHDTYRQACPHETARQIQAFAVGRRALRIRQTDA
jgi:CRISPR system Cascade subunit CasA